MEFNTLTTIAGIGFLAAIAQWVAWRVRLPAILFLLLFGILVGPVLSWLNPDDLFGDLLFPVISLSVAVILFEGSMTLRFAELKEVGSTVRNLVTVGALVTWAITSWLVHTVIGFEYKLAFLFGAVVVVTGPTVIVPMLRTVRPNKRIANILRWEGIVIDPLGALLAVLAEQFLRRHRPGPVPGHVDERRPVEAKQAPGTSEPEDPVLVFEELLHVTAGRSVVDRQAVVLTERREGITVVATRTGAERGEPHVARLVLQYLVDAVVVQPVLLREVPERRAVVATHATTVGAEPDPPAAIPAYGPYQVACEAVLRGVARYDARRFAIRSDPRVRGA